MKNLETDIGSFDPLLVAVIPVKPFASAKSRLADILSTDVRSDLARRLFLHTLTVLASCDIVDKIAVITSDSEAEKLAKSLGCSVVREKLVRGLNPALEEGLSRIKASGDTRILILPTDLPYISHKDISELAFGNTPAIAPDTNGTGTNGLYFMMRDKPRFCFGENSAVQHRDAFAETVNGPLRIIRRPGLSFDLDIPEDLQRFGRSTQNTGMSPTFRKPARAA